MAVVTAALTTAIVNATPAIALAGAVRVSVEDLRGVLPGIDSVVSRLEAVVERYCRSPLVADSRELDGLFERNLPLFMFDLVSAALPLSSSLLAAVGDASSLLRLRELGVELFERARPLLERAARERNVEPEPVIQAHAATVDYTLWLIDAVAEVGLAGLAERLTARAGEVIQGLVESLYSLLYAMMSVDEALLGGAPYRRDALEALIERCSRYAGDVEDYLDTLAFLIPDEEYNAVAEFLREAHE